MYPRRLEVTLAVNLLILVFASLLLSNIVSLILSQKEKQKTLIFHAEKTLINWEVKIFELLRKGSPLFLSDLRALKKQIGPSCLEVAYGDSQGIVQREAFNDKWSVDPLLFEAVTKNIRIVNIKKPDNFYLFFADRPLLLVLPIVDTGVVLGAVSVVLDFQPFSVEVVRNQAVLIMYSLLNLLVLVIVGFFRFSKIFIRPIDKLVEKFVQYDVSDGLPLITTDEGVGEFGKLSRSISGMLSRVKEDRKKLKSTITSLKEANLKIISTQQEMIKTEKIAAVGKLTAGLAHEIGNPIGIIQGYLELLKSNELDDEERLDYSTRSIEELDRINYLIEQLLGSTRIESGAPSVFSVQEVLGNVVEMVAVSTHEKILQITTKFKCLDDLVLGNREALHQVFLNCLLNAVDSIKEKNAITTGRVKVICENFQDMNIGKMIRITFEDSGVGIKETDRESIFEPFFTTKKAGEGTGLGLAVSQLAIDALQGRFVVAGEYGCGAIVQIELPAAEKMD